MIFSIKQRNNWLFDYLASIKHARTIEVYHDIVRTDVSGDIIDIGIYVADRLELEVALVAASPEQLGPCERKSTHGKELGQGLDTTGQIGRVDILGEELLGNERNSRVEVKTHEDIHPSGTRRLLVFANSSVYGLADAVGITAGSLVDGL